MPTQREMEMARGREIAARHAAEEKYRRAMEGLGTAADKEVAERRETLARWEEGRKVSYVRRQVGAITSDQGFQFDQAAYVDDGKGASVCVVTERYGPSWPSESYVAQVGLAIGALNDFTGIPEKSDRRRKLDEEAAQALQLRKRRDEERTRRNATGWKSIHEPDKK